MTYARNVGKAIDCTLSMQQAAPEHVFEPISEVPPGAQAAFRLR